MIQQHTLITLYALYWLTTLINLPLPGWRAIWRGIAFLCSIFPHLLLRKIPAHSCNTSPYCPPILAIIYIMKHISNVKHIMLLHVASLQCKSTGVPDMCCSVRLHTTIWPTQANYDFVPPLKKCNTLWQDALTQHGYIYTSAKWSTSFYFMLHHCNIKPSQICAALSDRMPQYDLPKSTMTSCYH